MVNIPQTQKAAVTQKEGGKIAYNAKQPVVKDLKSGQCLVKINYSGVCHTDLHAIDGDWPLHANFPLIGGHEGAGEVVAIGPNTTAAIKVGDHVGCKWLASSCLDCQMCRQGLEYCCAKATNHGFGEAGTFQQYLISDARHVTPIPKGLSDADAAPIMCAGVTVYAALKKIAQRHVAGSTIVIPGAGGGLGHLALQYAKFMGFKTIAIDTSSEKQQLCQKLGANNWIDFKKTKDLVKEIQGMTNGIGADAALVAAAKPEAYETAMEYIRPGGTVVAVGLPVNAKVQADVFFTVFQQKALLGSYVGNRQDAVEACQIAADGHVKTIYVTKPLSELPQIFEDMHKGIIAGRIVLDCNA